MPLLLCATVRPQPRRWIFAYWTIVITGIFTVTLHGFGETNPMFLPRWQWAFLDTGSNLLVAFAISRAALADFYARGTRRLAEPALAVALAASLMAHFLDQAGRQGAGLVAPISAWGGFNVGEACLIAYSALATALLLAKWRRIAPKARPILATIIALSLCGAMLASASNDRILWPFLPLHALWHVVSAAYLTLLWAFNHVRLVEAEAVPAGRSDGE
jgi:NADH:ubiquinone oxidoreductase subunit 2 (subunit N)